MMITSITSKSRTVTKHRGPFVPCVPIPQAQEDALVALSTALDLPFSGTWPVLMDVAELVNTGANASGSTAHGVKEVGEKA